MTEQPADFFWEVSAAALNHSDVATGTMMGFPCLRASLIDEARAFAGSQL
jgi:hypothetical protein